VIGFLDPRSADATADLVRAFRQGLKEAGYVEGENVAIEYRWAENQLDRLPALATDLVSRRVAVITTSSSAAAFAAKGATTTAPIVFVVPEDPVRLGLVASLARPGSNLTGINFFATEVTAKRLELLREMVSRITRFALLVEPNNPTVTEPTVRDVEAAARAMGLRMRILHANTSREIDAAFATFVHDRPDALFVGPGAFFNAIGSLGDASQDSGDVFGPSTCRSRRADELRNERDRCTSSDGRLCRSRPEGSEACRSAGHASDEVRAGHQSSDRQGPGP
jgi:putative tryptophan/tyrosine transport system substrate-binding protein